MADQPSWAEEATLAILNLEAYDAWPLAQSRELSVTFVDDIFTVNGGIFDVLMNTAVVPQIHQWEKMISFLEFCTSLSHIYGPTGETRAEATSRSMIANALEVPPRDSCQAGTVFRRIVLEVGNSGTHSTPMTGH